jgi:hypothetical protein
LKWHTWNWYWEQGIDKAYWTWVWNIRYWFEYNEFSTCVLLWLCTYISVTNCIRYRAFRVMFKQILKDCDLQEWTRNTHFSASSLPTACVQFCKQCIVHMVDKTLVKVVSLWCTYIILMRCNQGANLQDWLYFRLFLIWFILNLLILH